MLGKNQPKILYSTKWGKRKEKGGKKKKKKKKKKKPGWGGQRPIKGSW